MGIDFLSHDQGPKSQTVVKHLQLLDHELGSVFKILDRSESSKEREIVALLTADHGYDAEITQTINIEQALKRIDRRIGVLNEGRFVSFFFPSYWREDKKASLMQNFADHPLIDVTAYRQGDRILVQSQAQEAIIAYGPSSCKESLFGISVYKTENHFMKAAGAQMVCPEQLDDELNSLYYPYFISNLSHYFQSSGHPDAVLIPKPSIAFKRVGKGQHGGPTVQESFVPLLMHNGTLTEGMRIPALWDLLKFM